MKEYLFKGIDVTYRVVDHDCQGRAIEIPEGAEIAFKNIYGVGISFTTKDWMNDFSNGEKIPRSIKIGDQYKSGVVWQRHTQPEELPFLDDEPVEPVDSTPHNHYFKDVSDIDSIDVYEVLLRFGVTDPCLQHIVKKALCIGNRGHKSLKTDMKDIHDTAVRMLAMHGIS